MKRLLFLFTGLYACFISFSQNDSYPYTDWVKKLSDKNGPANSGIEEISVVVEEKDSIQSIAIFNELEKNANKKNHFFIARFYGAKLKILPSFIIIILKFYQWTSLAF